MHRPDDCPLCFLPFHGEQELDDWPEPEPEPED